MSLIRHWLTAKLFVLLRFELSPFVRMGVPPGDGQNVAPFSGAGMVVDLLRTCVMILRSETGRLVAAVAPELSPAASSAGDVDQRQQAVSMIQNSSIGRKTTPQNLRVESGSVVAPF